MKGDIEDLGGHTCIVCPWHNYKIDLETGEGVYIQLDMEALAAGAGHRAPQVVRSKGVKQRVHDVRIDEGIIFVKDTTPAEVRDELDRDALSACEVARPAETAEGSVGPTPDLSHKGDEGNDGSGGGGGGGSGGGVGAATEATEVALARLSFGFDPSSAAPPSGVPIHSSRPMLTPVFGRSAGSVDRPRPTTMAGGIPSGAAAASSLGAGVGSRGVRTSAAATAGAREVPRKKPVSERPSSWLPSDDYAREPFA